jgi:hypothetical protein
MIPWKIKLSHATIAFFNQESLVQQALPDSQVTPANQDNKLQGE